MSEADLSRAIEAASAITAAPSDLSPALSDAEHDTERLPARCTQPPKVKDSWFGECTLGDPSAKRLMVLFGDSHAGMWATSLDLVAQRTQYALRGFVQAGCPAPRITFFAKDAPNTACDAFRADAIAEIVREKPDIIVVTSATFFQKTGKSTFATSEEWLNGLSAVLDDLKPAGAKLVVLGDMPVLRQPAPECLAAHLHDIQKCATPRVDALENVYHEAEQSAATHAGATYIDPTSWFCSTVCPPVVGSMLVYRNRFHMTATYAHYISGVLRVALGL